MKTFFFYDLETSGLRPRDDRIMQFAGQRTDMELNPVGEPVNVLVKMTNDALPSPGAINVTGITPQQTLMDGISEAEFCKCVTEEIFVPDTIAVGYNTVRFDDEFMRACLWRNFYDPYEWEWKDGRSRWDILDVVRLTRALRPEGINWPFRDDGAPTNRLELITKLNGVSHEHAHDALSDVYATIAVAKLIRDKQPDLFNYLYSIRGKNDVKKLVNLENPKPFIYASGRYANEFNKTTVVFPIAPGRNGNVLVYDLRHNLERVLTEPIFSDAGLEKSGTSYAGRPGEPPALQANLSASSGIYVPDFSNHLMHPKKQVSATRSNFFPIVKELCYNKCPAVAPLGVLDKNGGWEKIGLDKETVEKNLQSLLAHPEFAEQMREEYENRPEFPPAEEPEGAIYDGFLNDADRVKVAVVRNAEPSKLVDLNLEFDDERLPELLLHYKGRNFPETLSESEMEQYEDYRKNRLNKQLPKFMAEIEKVSDDFVKQELLLYLQSLT
ncbi:exodeoxyribonuclease I [Candidatus Saccharibacteria bacterium]|nr:exodeoxyribonuclease I [Candidatus Saccharibacteria bacterium]